MQNEKYAKLIAASVSGAASATMLFYAWPILTQAEYSNIRWMVASMIGLIFIAFYQLLTDVLMEIL